MEQLEQDFLELLKKCEGTIFKVCLMFTDRQPDNVKDMYQDIVCDLWKGFPYFRKESSMNTWVYRIALNTAGMIRRKNRIKPSFISLDETVYNKMMVDESATALIDCLYELVDNLGKSEKSILLMYLDEIPQSEIAVEMGVSEAAINQMIYRIKKKLVKLNNN